MLADVRVRASAQLKQVEYFHVAQVIVITAALAAITKMGQQYAQKHWKNKKAVPFQERIDPRWAYGVLTVSYFVCATAVSGPYLKPLPAPPPQPQPEDPLPENPQPVDPQPIVPFQQPKPNQPSMEKIREAIFASLQALLEAQRNQEVELLRHELNVGGRRFSFEVNMRDIRAVQQCIQVHQQFISRVDRRLGAPEPRAALVAPPIQNGALIRGGIAPLEWRFRLARQLMRGPGDDFLPYYDFSRLAPLKRFNEVPRALLDTILNENVEQDFIFVNLPRPVLDDIGVSNQDLYGYYGQLLRMKLFRSLLNEYIYLLEEVEKVDLSKDYGLEALDILTKPELSKNAQDQYERFVDAHEALILSNKNEETAAICKALARVRMTPRIQSFQEDFVRQHIGDHEEMTLGNFAEIFVKRNKEIGTSDPNMRVDSFTRNGIMLYGAMSWAHYLKINPPQLRAMEDGVYYLRHATPNKYDSTHKRVIIDPLYREFLNSANGNVLYAAHQRLKDDGYPENEHVRCQTLVDLEGEVDNLLLLFQSVENTLYKKGAPTFAELKEKLVNSFYETDGHRLNRLPKALGPEYRDRMVKICDFIHATFFDNKVDVDPTLHDIYGGLPEEKKTGEWQLFIMLFYYYQREDIKKRFDVKYVNTGCKDDFDRGGGQNIISDLIHLTEIYGKEIPSERLQGIADSVQAPTLQLKGNEPIKYRVHPALCLSQLLQSLSEEKIRTLKEKGRVHAHTVEKRRNQTALYLPQEARTLEEYQLILTSLKGKTYTLFDRSILENHQYQTKEEIIPQLERNYSNGLFVDGYQYDGTTGWHSYPYTAEKIYEILTQEQELSAEKAVDLMNLLEVQIFASPFEKLKNNLQTDTYHLRSLPNTQSPIRLTTAGDSFKVDGSMTLEIVDVSQDGTQVATINLSVKVEIPTGEGRPTAEWSWSV